MPSQVAANSDATFSEEIFNEWSGIPALTQIEAIVEPDSIRNDVRREAISFICIHHLILSTLGT